MKKILFAVALCLTAVTITLAETAVEDLIKLARSGVDGEVLLAYVENSPEPFNLNADDIITLKDLGVPAQAINAAMHRGQALDSLAAVRGTTAAASDAGAGDGKDTAAATSASQVVPPAENLNISFFYDVLMPYGRWIQIDGEWCWQPNAGLVSADWAPYYNHGRWVYTDWGWCWVSDYSWGWAPFHYGRWFRHQRYGWCWWPDHEWGPAWVVWRFGGGYWGWAPLPRHIRYVRHHGFYHGKRRLRRDYDFNLTWKDYFYLPTGHVADPRPWVHIIPPKRGRDIFEKTSFDPSGIGDEGGRIFNRGPMVDDVAAGSNKPITPVPIVDVGLKTGQPITNGSQLPNRLEIYTPKINPDTPRPPVVPPTTGSLLPDVNAGRQRDAEQQALEKRRAEAEAAERERKVLIDSAQRERDRNKRDELRIEVEVRDQRVQQAKEDMVRIKQRKPEPVVPAPQPPSQPEPPQLRNELRNQVQSDANEELQKRQAMEDLLRKPAVQDQTPAGPGKAPAPQGGVNKQKEKR